MKQVEFYFSEENLPNDKFLLKKLDGDQTVTLDTIMSFKRIKKLSADAETHPISVRRLSAILCPRARSGMLCLWKWTVLEKFTRASDCPPSTKMDVKGEGRL